MIYAQIGVPVLDTLAERVIAHAVRLFKIPADVDIYICGTDVPEDADAEVGYREGTGDGSTQFLIALNWKSGWTLCRLAEIIGHEMTHVKQYLFDGLRYGTDSTTMYKRKAFRMKNDAEYYLAPWEIEARGMQEYFAFVANREKWLDEPA